MKKTIKLVSIFLVLALTFTLTGCSSDELSFLQAMEKTAKINSCTATSEVTAKITANIPEEFNKIGYSSITLKSVLNSLKNFKFTTDTVMSKSKDDILGKVEYGVSSDDISFKATAYVKSDKDNLIEVFKIPSIYKWLLPEDKMDAEYMTLDMSELSKFMKEEDLGINYSIDGSKLSEKSDKLIEAYIKFQSEYAKKMPNSPKVITKTGNTYKLSFSDSSLKLFLRAIVDTYLKEADAKKAVEEFGNSIIAFYDGMYPGMITDEMKESVKGLSSSLSGTQAQVDMIFAMLDKFPILGEKGININYYVDSKGFISKADGYVDLFIDMNKIATLTGGEAYEEAFNFDILLNFKAEYSKINEPVTIAIPALTDKNNISYVGIMKGIKEANQDNYNDGEYGNHYVKPVLPAEDGSISIINYGRVVDFGDLNPEIFDGTLYVPLSDELSRELYLGFSWNFDENVATIYNGNRKFYLFPGDPTLYNEDFSLTLSKKPISYNGQIYMPLKTFLKAFRGQTLTWNEEENAAYIGWGY